MSIGKNENSNSKTVQKAGYDVHEVDARMAFRPFSSYFRLFFTFPFFLRVFVLFSVQFVGFCAPEAAFHA